MTEVANKDLCAELYELSGWTITTGHIDIAYNLGYLIRKVGSGAGVIKNFEGYTARRPSMLGVPENKDPLNGRIGWDASTPEDAMCIMLIELIRKGMMDVASR